MKKILNCFGSLEPLINWQKLLLKMKLSTILIFCVMINLVANPGYSQDTKISLDARNLSVKDVLTKIEDSSEFYFLFNQKLIDVERKVDITANEKPIKDILDDIFGDDIKFMVSDRQIILAPTSTNETASASMQQIALTGTIRDNNGEGLPGVNVLLKGTTIGAITDINGRYSINVPDLNGTLVVSFIGYTAKEEAIGGRRTVDVVLEEETTALDEVVVIGYGTKVKSTVTGSISSVRSEDLQTFSASTNVVDALQANVSGAFVLANSGRPGETSNIYLRGPVSVNGGNPLYVIDGIPQDNLGYNFNL